MEVAVLEDDLRKTNKTYSSAITKLILRVKKLEARGRKLSDAEVQEKASTENEPFIQEVTPTEVIQDQGSSEKGSAEISTAGATKGTASEVPVVSTAEENLSTTGRTVTYTRRTEEKRTRQDKGKEIMIESEPKKKSKKELEQERLSFAEAIRLKEQMNEEQRAHIARDEEIARQWDEEERQRAMSEAKSTKKIDWNDPSVIRYHALKMKPKTVAQARRNDFNQHIEPMEHGSEKMKSPEKIEEEDIQEEMKEVVKESGAKRKKSLPRKRRTVKRQKLEEDAEKEELKGFLDIILREDVAEDVESLSTKGDGSFKNYKVLSEMLKEFDRQDVEELYRLVKERYSASRPEGYDLMLWGDLHTLFEPDEEDEIWKNQHEYNVISWSLYDFCGIHILLMQNGIAIHMLTEKKYPLSQETITKMLNKRLEVDHESSQAFELLRFIRSQNVNVVCATCGKCVFNSNHDARVSKYLNDVNARTKKPKVVPISTRKPHRKKTFASESTVQNSKSYYRMLYEKTSKAWKWWIEQQCPSGYKWVPKTKMIWGNNLLTGNRGSDLYIISLQETTSSTLICLMAKASPTQAWLWHQRLSHLNFDYINLLLKKDVVIGLPKLKYVKDQLCSFCKVSKAKRSSFKTKTVASSKGRLNFLHMDLCGPMRVASINGKKYILNGIVKRRNPTLVEAARTMLSASKLPLFFWAKAIATACYTQNRSIIIPTYEKMTYHIINDRKPSIKHLHIFGCTCYLTRDGENLDKMKEKGDPCILVGYSTQSKGYRVYNKRTRLIVESIHLRFDEIKEMSETSVANDTLSLVPQRQKTSDYDNSNPNLQLQNGSPSADTTVPSQQELDLLFGPLYDEFFNTSTSRVNKSSSPTDNSAPQDTNPLTNIQPTSEPTTPTNAHAEENNDNQADDTEHEFTNPFCTPVQEVAESSSRNMGNSNMHTFNQP
ncbi:retrovirus-related pol polyprotein from transposon TNT 1-94 [Tanacetum coccineum]